ncbi:MAG TPA: MMPL family transporter [Polyangia bacterium]|nr:MMPL family transporter [Polyangia bacterium]
MPLAERERRFAAYAAWLERRRRRVSAAGLLVAAAGLLLALRLPLRADLSNLLPSHERSVRDLERIESRTTALGIVLCAVASDDPTLRAKGAQVLAAQIRRMDPALVADVVVDDSAARAYVAEHRFLFAPLADLEAARDVLAARIQRAHLAANPLYVSLDDPEDQAREKAEEQRTIDKLRKRLDDAAGAASTPREIVSQDGRTQVLVVQAAFPSASVSQGERLVAALAGAIGEARRAVGPGVSFGMTEDVVIAVAEHRAILGGMSLALLLTILVVGGSMLLYFRSASALAALLGALAVGTLATFGFVRLTIGHLNSVTAFLSSIVVGNGINFGIIVLARYLEERRRGRTHAEALACALGGSFTGTLAAALAAGIAYASLIITDFRGFRDFGVIGGVGMVFCWLTAYTVLPALLSSVNAAGRLKVRREPGIGRLVARLASPRPAPILIGCGALVLVSTALTVRYLASDPFEYNWRRLRSDSGMAREARRWMTRIDDAFGRQFVGGFMVGVGSPAQASEAEKILRAHAEDEPGVTAGQALFRRVGSLQDFIPADQSEKIEVLGELRRLVDKAGDALGDDAGRFRPPEGLRPLTAADIPEPLARRYVERSGARGELLVANQASRFDGWNGRDMIAFVGAVRALPLPPETALGGGAFVFADVLRAVVRAGPRATLAASLGVAAFVLVVLGWGRHAVVTFACVATGVTLMIAGAALLGLKVNFLDFVALPITLGISVDYSVNVVARETLGGAGAVRGALATTGGAVVLCSWTTTVGYASLLLSANAGIRSFGLTAILGELTCLLAALIVAPALLTAWQPGRRPARDR